VGVSLPPATAPAIASSSDATPPATDAVDPLTASPPAVVALVQPTPAASVPGRDDTAVSTYFLSREGVNFTTIAMDPTDAGLCQKVTAAGHIAVAGWHGVDPALRTCLLAAGVDLVAFDAGGQGDPATAAHLVPTRRGTTETLIDLAGSPLRSALTGHMAIVASAANRAAVQQALPAMAAQGVTPVTVTYLDAAPADAVEIATGVTDLYTKGVTTVLFATTVDQQTRWAAHQSVLVPAMHYVVADTDDAIVRETYAPVMEGAVSYTAYRSPWFQRAHAETAPQTACRTAWESSVQPAAELTPEELADVFVWCEEAELVSTAMRSTDADHTFTQVARAQTVDSPVTSPLAPLAGGGYGPTEGAVITWHASCACWSETQPFSRRAGS
jgi:hypothetical protein